MNESPEQQNSKPTTPPSPNEVMYSKIVKGCMFVGAGFCYSLNNVSDIFPKGFLGVIVSVGLGIVVGAGVGYSITTLHRRFTTIK